MVSLESIIDLSSLDTQKMTLAILGGFGSDLIFTIMQKLVDKIKNLIT